MSTTPFPRTREEVQEALDAIKADTEPVDADDYGRGFDTGYQSALEWVLKSEPWTVAI